MATPRASASCSARSSPTTSRSRSPTPAWSPGATPTAEDMEPMSWAIYSMIGKLGAVEGMAAAVRLQAFARRLVSFLLPYDALLTPALAERPLPLGTLDTAAPEPMSTFTRSGYFTPFTPVFNASGQPGISVPLYQGEDGLPLGVQLVGRPAGEGPLLALAAQLEAASPWAQRRVAAMAGDGERLARRPAPPPSAAARPRALRRRPRRARRSSRPPSARPRPTSRTPPGPSARSSSAQAARDERRRHVHERATASERAQHRAHDLEVAERLRSGELVAQRDGWRSLVARPVSSARARRSPRRPRPRSAGRPRGRGPSTGIAGSSARRSSSVSHGSPGA